MEKDYRENLKGLPEFDADLLPDHPKSNVAAETMGLRYDPIQNMYIDSDGCLIRDEYGQPLG